MPDSPAQPARAGGALGTGLSGSALLLLLAAATLLRVGWVALVPVIPVSDSHAYDTFARTLLGSGVFGWVPDHPFAFWPPGTSFIYAALFGLFGTDYKVIVVLNVLLSAALIVLTTRVANRLRGSGCAVFAGWVLALWPTLIMFTTVLASELPFLVLVTAALDVWLMPAGAVLRRGVIAGVLLGCAALVRPVALLLPVIFGAALVMQHGLSRANLATQLRLVAPALLAMACVIAPWTARNYQLYGEVILISTNGGITLWMGNAPGTTGEHMNLPEWAEKLPDNEQDRALGKLAKSYIVNDPGAFVVRSFRKLVWLFSHESIGVAWNEAGLIDRFGAAALRPLKLFTHVTWGAIFVTAVAGLIVLVRAEGVRQALLSPVVMTIAFYSAVHSIVVSQDRYHLEFAVQLALLAGVALNALWLRWHAAPPDNATAPAWPRRSAS